MQRIEILIVSYLLDRPWLVHCLNSIRMFGEGFSGVTVLVPRAERTDFEKLTSVHGVRLASYDRHANPARWHLDHQRMKCRADQVCPDADGILHLDSDCVFTERVTPDDYLRDGRPVLVVKPYAAFTSTLPPWRDCTEAAVGWAVHHETMCRLPALHWLGLYEALRTRVETVHGRPFDDYVLGCTPTFPWGFSEFNALGQLALSPAWRDRYHFVDKSTETPPPSKLRQFWSHGGFHSRKHLPAGDGECAADLFRRLGI
jgi:hypothetical protein